MADNDEQASKHAKALSVRGASKGGKARAKSMTAEERTQQASHAAKARWGHGPEVSPGVEIPRSDFETDLPSHGLPVAKYKGVLAFFELPCYVLDNGQRVIGRTSATEMLTGIKGGGALEKYLGVAGFKPFIDMSLVLERMVAFRLPEVEGLEKGVKGLSADMLIDICRGMVQALEQSQKPDSGTKLSDRQAEMAAKAGIFLAACAKVGLDALIDEATGYQYERAEDALQLKLKAYLSEEMRKWEKTFPDELWREFARLTNWKGSVTQRPKYWGHLVNELVYEYLDKDVALWLKANAPKPRHGQNYHQWLSSQFGLKKLVEHIWMLVGISKTCKTMTELKDRMAEVYGKVPVQYRFYFPLPGIKV